MVDIATLPKEVIGAIANMQVQVAALLEPITQKVSFVDPRTMQVATQDKTIEPKVQIFIEMPAKGVVQVIVQRTKPFERPVVLRQFEKSEFDALNLYVQKAGVSWEEFFTQAVIHNGR